MTFFPGPESLFLCRFAFSFLLSVTGLLLLNSPLPLFFHPASSFLHLSLAASLFLGSTYVLLFLRLTNPLFFNSASLLFSLAASLFLGTRIGKKGNISHVAFTLIRRMDDWLGSVTDLREEVCCDILHVTQGKTILLRWCSLYKRVQKGFGEHGRTAIRQEQGWRLMVGGAE